MKIDVVANVVNPKIIGETGAAKGLTRDDNDRIACFSPALIKDELVDFFDKARGEFWSFEGARPNAKHDRHAAQGSSILAKGNDRNGQAQL